MSLFGKKDKDEDLTAGTPQGPTAQRPAPLSQIPEEKGPRGLLILLLVLLIAVGGGGYYYLASLAEEPLPMPPLPLREASRLPAPIPPPAPAPATANVAPAPAAPAVPAPAATPAAPATTALGTPPVDANAPPAAPATAPVPAPAGTEIPKDVNVVPARPLDTTQEPVPASPSVKPAVVPAPGADLPVPPEAQLPPKTPPVPAPVPAPAPKKADNAPTEAEKAIVENAPVLDQISHPAEKTAAKKAAPEPEIAAQEALVRPMPKEYVTVKKNHGADDLETRITTARTALGEGRIEAALQMFSDLYKDHPKDRRVLMGRAVTLQKSGQADAALKAYEEVLDQDPKNLEALTNMLGLLKSQDRGLALAKLDELRRDYPSNADIAAQLGISYGAGGDYKNALKYLDIADALSPGSMSVLYNKAVVRDKMGDLENAALLYAAVLQKAADGANDAHLPLDAIRARLAVLR
jgi:Flp pilus assembly protein TadD